jgi:hypothetical protein
MEPTRHPDVDKFEAALERGKLSELRRIWPHVRELCVDAIADWVTLADLAHDERVDRRTMLRRLHGKPYLWRVRPGLWLVDRNRYRAARRRARDVARWQRTRPPGSPPRGRAWCRLGA